MHALDAIRNMVSLLSDVKHPLEGITYLFIIALIIRWKWPLSWNDFLMASDNKNDPQNPVFSAFCWTWQCVDSFDCLHKSTSSLKFDDLQEMIER